MRNLLKLIKNLSFLLCFGFGLNYMVVPVMAQSIVPPVIEEEAPDEEEIGGWSTLDKKTQETIAKNQARNAAAGQSDEARAIYDAQQQRYDQHDREKLAQYGPAGELFRYACHEGTSFALRLMPFILHKSAVEINKRLICPKNTNIM